MNKIKYNTYAKMNKILFYILPFIVATLINILSNIVSDIKNFNEETIRIDKESVCSWPYWNYMK